MYARSALPPPTHQYFERSEGAVNHAKDSYNYLCWVSSRLDYRSLVYRQSFNLLSTMSSREQRSGHQTGSFGASSAPTTTTSRPTATTPPPAFQLQVLPTQATNTQNAVATVRNTSTPQSTPPVPNNSLSSVSNHSTATTRRKWNDLWIAPNGIAIVAVVLALVFGTGAWAGMNMQIKQAARSLELTVWATCADHEVCIPFSLLVSRGRES